MNKEIHNESDQEKFNHLSKLKEIIVVKDKHIQRLEKVLNNFYIYIANQRDRNRRVRCEHAKKSV